MGDLWQWLLSFNMCVLVGRRWVGDAHREHCSEICKIYWYNAISNATGKSMLGYNWYGYCTKMWLSLKQLHPESVKFFFICLCHCLFFLALLPCSSLPVFIYRYLFTTGIHSLLVFIRYWYSFAILHLTLPVLFNKHHETLEIWDLCPMIWSFFSTATAYVLSCWLLR